MPLAWISCITLRRFSTSVRNSRTSVGESPELEEGGSLLDAGCEGDDVPDVAETGGVGRRAALEFIIISRIFDVGIVVGGGGGGRTGLTRGRASDD